MKDLKELYYLRNNYLKSKDPETLLIGRLLNTIIIADDKKQLPELALWISGWVTQQNENKTDE